MSILAPALNNYDAYGVLGGYQSTVGNGNSKTNAPIRIINRGNGDVNINSFNGNNNRAGQNSIFYGNKIHEPFINNFNYGNNRQTARMLQMFTAMMANFMDMVTQMLGLGLGDDYLGGNDFLNPDFINDGRHYIGDATDTPIFWNRDPNVSFQEFIIQQREKGILI